MSLPKCFLEGKVAIVTGASAGIGAHIAVALANAGVNLVLAARSRPGLEALQRQIVEQTAVKVLAVPTDVASPTELQRLVDESLREFGRIDILVNNAGREAFRSLHALSVEEITRTVQVNLTGALQLTRLVIPHMLPNGWGHVVNMASTAGKFGPPYAGVYAATKAGLIAFTQSLRTEYRRHGIRATAICPGFTDAGGIYDRIREELGRDPPRFIGQTTADRVARATIRAIRKDQPEVIVNSPPLRPFFALAAWLPSLGEWMVRKFAGRYFRRLAELRQSASDDSEIVRRDAA